MSGFGGHKIMLAASDPTATQTGSEIANPSVERLGGTAEYRAYTLTNYRQLPQVQDLPKDYRLAIEVIGQVLPFKTNSYVVNELIDWQKAPNDPLFLLNFPHPEMLNSEHFDTIARLLRRRATKSEVRAAADQIRLSLNPHPAGQLDHNVPVLNGQSLRGMQHKYRETVLFFPSQGQTCHAYCTFCFRWPQFVGIEDLKFSMHEKDLLLQYLQEHLEVTDLLMTGGDPLIMHASILAGYLLPLLEPRFSHLSAIRLGTKVLSYWPYRFLTDRDATPLLVLLERLTESGKHVTLMAHFNHPRS